MRRGSNVLEQVPRRAAGERRRLREGGGGTKETATCRREQKGKKGSGLHHGEKNGPGREAAFSGEI